MDFSEHHIFWVITNLSKHIGLGVFSVYPSNGSFPALPAESSLKNLPELSVLPGVDDDVSAGVQHQQQVRHHWQQAGPANINKYQTWFVKSVQSYFIPYGNVNCVSFSKILCILYSFNWCLVLVNVYNSMNFKDKM